MFENRRWVILPVNDVTESMISDCMQESIANLRKSVDKTKTFLKWEGQDPDWASNLTVLNHSQMIEALNTEEWIGQ